MNRTFVRALALTAVVALAACQGGGMNGSAIPAAPGAPVTQDAPQPSSAAPADESDAHAAQDAALPTGTGVSVAGDGEIPIASADAIHRVCAPVRQPGEKTCFAIERRDLRVNRLGQNVSHQGYGPSDLTSAYNISGARSSLVAIVDAYGYPQASSDLAKYRAFYGLPACTTGNQCLKLRNQTGGTNLPKADQGWDSEQALDLDMVSAMCPKCKILLVESNSNFTSDLYAAASEAAKLGAAVISNSYGGSESAQCGGGGEQSDPAFSAPGHVFVASSGDQGGGLKNCGGPQQPCSLATVVCVGGTLLVHGHTQRGWKESVWNELSNYSCTGSCGGAGSGCSTIVKKPAWQTDPTCKMRSEADVSAEASVLTPVAVYFGGYGGWTAFGGTSVSTPLVAGIFGRAGNGGSGNGPRNLWTNRSHLNDLTVGNNLYAPLSGNCASSAHYICYAGKGFDGPTGLGSPNGLAAF
ncbi:MAG TPA: S8 family serine peptidase [Candidatus Tumulicola sp.]